jgi:hypothetical protein
VTGVVERVRSPRIIQEGTMRTILTLVAILAVGCTHAPVVDDHGGDAAASPDASQVVTGPDDPGSMTSDARILIADGRSFVIDDVGAAVEQALATGGADNLIVYVHGRSCGGGGEPAKSLAGAMPALESDYQAKALMFTWPGSNTGCPIGFPETEARASGLAFAHTLRKLAFYKFTHASRFAGLSLTLVTHSMGNLVLEAAVEQDPVPLPAALFDTVILNSSATALASHAAWLANVHLAGAVYVTENAHDNVLAAAGLGRGTRLGVELGSEPLAATAIYVDFTASNVNHAYYIHSGQNGLHMRAFYDTVMNGSAFDFGAAAGIARAEPRDGTWVYTFDGQ